MPDGVGSPVAIVGAGLAGLTAALALAQRGVSCTVVEQAPTLLEIGAGIQLSPNATRILDALGLTGALAPLWHEPDEIRLTSGRDLRPLGHVPAGPAARRRWGAPYAVIHRADFQNVLVDAVRRNKSIGLRLAAPVDPVAGNLVGALEDLTGARPALVVGADGVWSSVRSAVAGHGRAVFIGQVAWRMTVGAADAADILDPSMLTAFLGPSTHLVAYPMKSRREVNLVAVTDGGDAAHGWGAENPATPPRDLARHFVRWAPRLRRLLESVPAAARYPIHQVTDGRWHSEGNCPVVLIGDAAHAMAPYAAQGAAMAIEDAWVLASVLADDLKRGADISAALPRYEAIRRPRIDQVRRRAAFNRFAYHARGPFRLGRDAVLALRRPESLAADFDWLYGDRSLL